MGNNIGGELVPATVDWHDERGWTDQESLTSDRMRKTWKMEEGFSYIRTQTVGLITKIFPAELQANTVEFQSNSGKDPIYGFPGIFYYKVIPVVAPATSTPTA